MTNVNKVMHPHLGAIRQTSGLIHKSGFKSRITHFRLTFRAWRCLHSLNARVCDGVVLQRATDTRERSRSRAKTRRVCLVRRQSVTLCCQWFVRCVHSLRMPSPTTASIVTIISVCDFNIVAGAEIWTAFTIGTTNQLKFNCLSTQKWLS